MKKAILWLGWLRETKKKIGITEEKEEIFQSCSLANQSKNSKYIFSSRRYCFPTQFWIEGFIIVLIDLSSKGIHYAAPNAKKNHLSTSMLNFQEGVICFRFNVLKHQQCAWLEKRMPLGSRFISIYPYYWYLLYCIICGWRWWWVIWFRCGDHVKSSYIDIKITFFFFNFFHYLYVWKAEYCSLLKVPLNSSQNALQILSDHSSHSLASSTIAKDSDLMRPANYIFFP